LPDMHPHQLQHAFVTSWRAGGNENEVMLVVERIRTMIDRDTKATAAHGTRAIRASDRPRR
jgi:hypothetical protein